MSFSEAQALEATRVTVLKLELSTSAGCSAIHDKKPWICEWAHNKANKPKKSSQRIEVLLNYFVFRHRKEKLNKQK